MTKSLEIAADIQALIRARNPLLVAVTREEARVEGYLVEVAKAAKMVPLFWDAAQGVTDMAGRVLPLASAMPDDILRVIAERSQDGSEPTLWILRDLLPWFSGPAQMTGPLVRQMRNLARLLPASALSTAQAIIVLSTTSDLPADLAAHATVIDWPLPDREEIADLLDGTLGNLPDEWQDKARPTVAVREAAIDAALGLTGAEAESCYSRSLVQTKAIDPALISREKKQVVAKEKVLEWVDPLPGGLDAVGGLDVLKGWLAERRLAYSPEARAYGLPMPKGVFLGGMSGCGKSLSAKAIATFFGVPLLRVDLGALKDKYVGGSEARLRTVFRVIGALGRCVVWFDEVEKSLGGAINGAADGGVSTDQLGAILTWMQEARGEAFVVATANDVAALPPEFLRKGRFDELFFIDLPTRRERAEIVLTSLRAHNRAATVTVDAEAVADATEGFAGAEVAELIPAALFTAFADGGREPETRDLLAAAATTVPLAKTASAKVDALRSWAQGRARPATTPEAATAGRKARVALDLA